MKNDFTATEIYKALKIPKERLRAWMKLKFITPTLPVAGQGRTAIFTRTDIYCIELFKKLIANGFNRKGASDYLKGFIERKEFKNCSYIYFRSTFDNGEHYVSAAIVPEDEIVTKRISFDWKTGSLIFAVGIPILNKGNNRDGINILSEKNDDWDNIHIQNFKRLKKEVDEALKRI
jgi:hypothetical protein